MRLLKIPLLRSALAITVLPVFAISADSQNPLAHDPLAQDTTTTDPGTPPPPMTPEQVALIDRYLTTVHAEPAGQVDTKNAAAGQGITLHVTADVTLANGAHLPKGTQLTGRILRAQAWQPQGPAALLSIGIDRAVLKDGSSVPIRCVIRMVTRPAGPSTNLVDASQPGSRRGRGGGGSSPSIGGPASGVPLGSPVPLGNPTPMGGGPVGTDTGGMGGLGGADSSANGSVYGNPNSTNPRNATTTGGIGGMPAGDPGIGGSGTTGTRAAVGNSTPVPLTDPELPVTAAGETIHDVPRRTGITGVMLSGASVTGVSGTLSAYDQNITLDSATQLTLGIITAK
ncbi:MAG TPA: hypothetical protein VII58_13930 [Acidobacteriaceae bacterium]